MEYTAVAAVSEIEEKSFTTCDVDGRGVLICRFRGEYYAVENKCSHARATFDGGRLRGFQLICPKHGATFDVRDGSPTSPPARKPVRTFPVRVVDGTVEVALGADPDADANPGQG